MVEHVETWIVETSGLDKLDRRQARDRRQAATSAKPATAASRVSVRLENDVGYRILVDPVPQVVLEADSSERQRRVRGTGPGSGAPQRPA